jgi:hypothetical protein
MEEVKYNIGLQQLYSISNMIDHATSNYRKGNLKEYFYCLKSIKLLIISKLKEDERELLSKYEDIICKLFSALKNNDPKNRHDLSEILENYDVKIKDYLDKKGFLVPVKQDRASQFKREMYGDVSASSY